MGCEQEKCSSSCGSGSGSCGCSSGSGGGAKSCSQGGCPACGGACGGDVVACSMILWKMSFFKAMKEVQVDLLKAKIQKAWGPMMDKAADLALEGMGAKWQGMMNEQKMKCEMREKFENLYRSSK